MLDAFKNIFEFEPEIKLLMIGKGNDEEYVKEYSADNNLGVKILSPRVDILQLL